MPLKGIDVSSHQGQFPWTLVKPNIDFAILRSSHGMNEKDVQFERNYAECKRLGIPVGVYHYFYYSDYGKHLLEMQNFLSVITGKTFDFPAFVDYEEGNFLTPSKLGGLSKDKITQYAKEDIAKLKKRGFKAGIYANTNWLTNKVDATKIDADMVWLAQYASKPTYAGHYDMWQYTSAGAVPGYAGRLDMNYYYPPVDQGVAAPVRLGERSSRVIKMQTLLKQKAYPVTVDGVFGSQTEKTLKQFQLDNDLKADGICGVKTWEKLDSVVKYSLKADGDKYVSKNFKVKEFACKDGSDEVLICKVNVERLQAFRTKIGKPIHINSGYRTVTYNKRVGGASDSLHTFGYATDFYVDGMTPAQVYALLNPTHKGGLGKYKTFTHMDSGRRRRWFG